MPGTELARGRIYAALLTHIGAEKYFVVVSNNRRNRHFGQVLAVRITTTPAPLLPSVVELYPDEVRRDLGALSRATMARVFAGLRAALDL